MTSSLPEHGTLWDAVIIGSGPAGATAAHQLARSGHSVLLIDRDTFPRSKVCGGCLSGAGVRALRSAGLGGTLDALNAPPLTATRLIYRGREARLRLGDGVAVSRVALDPALASSAVATGATWLQGVAATPLPCTDITAGWREVALQASAGAVATQVRARVVLRATGLGKQDNSPHHPKHRSLVGLGSVVQAAALRLPRGEVVMLCSPYGYLGICTVENDTTHLAAAVEAAWLRNIGGPQKAIAEIGRQGGSGLQGVLETVRWRGTAPLATLPPITTTRRCLTLGDAAGSVAPFTGEGMGNAVQSAIAVAPIAAAIVKATGTAETEQQEQEWRRQLRLLRRSQRTNRTIARVLRTPWALHSAHALLRQAPVLARPVVAGLARPSLGTRPS